MPQDHYTDKGYRDKLADQAKAAGKDIVFQTLKLYFVATSNTTPLWAKTASIAALAYFISPVDAIPDFTPLIGYTDDATTVAGAVATIGSCITPIIVKQASDRLKRWFS